MLTSQFGRCIGLFAVLCVLLLFLFPLVSGPFPVTHGPATALRARRFSLLLLFGIIAAALQIFTLNLPAVPGLWPRRRSRSGNAVLEFSSVAISGLRC